MAEATLLKLDFCPMPEENKLSGIQELGQMIDTSRKEIIDIVRRCLYNNEWIGQCKLWELCWELKQINPTAKGCT
jgi:hypothetical protein